MSKLPVFVVAALASAALSANEVVVNGRHFTLPSGFQIELAAGTNLVQRPVSASFDTSGHLFVTDSSGSSEAPDQQIKHPSHRILRLDDTDRDGRFDKAAVFADQVMFPQGCLWYQGSVYVAAPPSIWKFTDADGDGIAEQRSEWWKGGTLTGCANDIHGPYLGPDGFIYWTKGAFAEQTHERPGRKTINDKAAHVYRSLPDGSELDLVMSGGMDNPVEVAFGPDGEAFFTSTFIDFSQPGRRDGIAHAVYGGVYGKHNRVIEDGRVKRSQEDLLPVMTQFGAGAACGLCRYESTAFGADYQNNLFATTFNLHKITRHVLKHAGASFSTEDSDFLTCSDVDFHPTDVLEDKDGSLLVVDTGGWYKLCCPSSQLAKPDVLGAIYRVRRVGGPPVERSNLGDLPNHVEDTYWKLKAAGQLRDRTQISTLLSHLERYTSNPTADNVRLARVAAESLGRIGSPAAVPQLLAAAARADDPFIAHSITFALIEINAPAPTRAGLASDSPGTARAALIALDQMDAGDLKPSEVLPWLDKSDPRLRATAEWVLGHHTPWGTELTESFRSQLRSPEISPVKRGALNAQLHLFADSSTTQGFLAELTSDLSMEASTRIAALEAISGAGLKESPDVWNSAIAAILSEPASKPELLTAAVHAASHGHSNSGVAKGLHSVAVNPGNSTELRLTALETLPPSELTSNEFDFLKRRLEASSPPNQRSMAAETLAKSKLTEAQKSEIAILVAVASPLELTKLLGAFDAGGSDALGQILLDSLEKSASARSLVPSQVTSHFGKFSEAIQVSAKRFANSINVDAARQGASLEALLTELKSIGGDIRRGQALFNGPKAACSSCHRIGYLGGEVGPELTNIGEARTERDLLESIVYPSASFVRSFEPSVITLKDGDQVNGIIRHESPEELTVATGPGPEIRIKRSNVADTKPGTVSVMPAGLADALTRTELADILTFVKTVRWR